MTCECWPALRPMSSAPRDGTPILASFPAYSGSGDFARRDVRVIQWSGWGGGVWDNDSGHHLGQDATPIGWRPLPPRELGRWDYKMSPTNHLNPSSEMLWIKE